MSVIHYDPDYKEWGSEQIEKLLRLLSPEVTTFHILFETSSTFKDVIPEVKEYFPSSHTSSSTNGIAVFTKPLNNHTIMSIVSLFQENKNYRIKTLRIVRTQTGTIEVDIWKKKISMYNAIYTPTVKELYDIFPDIVKFTHYFDSENP